MTIIINNNIKSGHCFEKKKVAPLSIDACFAFLRRPSFVVVHNFFFSETAWLINLKFYLEPP